MHYETGEQWKLLCEQAAKEHDSSKLIQLVREINNLLEDKRSCLDNKKTAK